MLQILATLPLVLAAHGHGQSHSEISSSTQTTTSKGTFGVSWKLDVNGGNGASGNLGKPDRDWVTYDLSIKSGESNWKVHLAAVPNGHHTVKFHYVAKLDGKLVADGTQMQPERDKLMLHLARLSSGPTVTFEPHPNLKHATTRDIYLSVACQIGK